MTSTICYRLAIVLVLILACLTGCARAETDHTSPPPPTWEDALDLDIPLATGSGSGDHCQPLDISLAEWLAHGDALVFGRVKEVSWTDVPAAVFGHAQSRHHTVTFEDDCAGTIIPALEVTLDGLQVLYEHEPGIASTAELTLLFSTELYLSWHSMPQATDDGGVGWSSDEGGLRAGQWIGGILLHHPKPGLWGIQTRFHLMQVMADGTVRAPDMSDHPLSCLRLEPWIDRAHVDTLAAAVHEIDWSASELSESIARIREEIGEPGDRTNTLFWFHSAQCHEPEPSDPLPPYECFGEGNCEPGQRCVDFLCVD